MSGSGKVSSRGDLDRRRKAMSIEQLLVWAYGEQMVHLAQRGPIELNSGSKGPLASHSSLWTECAPVDGGGQRKFDAADDAWRVHEIVKTLRKVTVDCGQDLAAARYHQLQQYRGAEPPLGRPGSVDHSGRPWPTNGLLAIDVPALVVFHANKAIRPEWPDKPDFHFAPDQMVRKPGNPSGVYKLGWFQHVRAVGILPGEVAEAQQIYSTWWHALDDLRDRLQATRLTMFTVTDAMPALA